MSPSEELILYWLGSPLYLMVRQADGVFKENWANYWNPSWQSAYIYGAVFTPDSKYAVVSVQNAGSGQNDNRSLGVIQFTAGKRMVRTGFNPLWMASKIAITPDGEFVAVSWQYYLNGFRLNIYRVNSNATLTLLSTTVLPDMVWCTEILPQAKPPNQAEEPWEIYE